MALTPGSRLGPYEILSPLGAGGMGEVYKARDTRLGREVAIKVLPPELAGDAERRHHLEREARAASALNHPSIVTVYDVGSVDGVLFIAMELVEGQTLRDLLNEGPLRLHSALEVAAQIAEGLAKAHGGGIVHRDLKPENLIVSADGFVKILDFGLAKLVEAPVEASSLLPTEAPGTTPGSVLGTVGYMSPEQASGKPVDVRSDQFSLGSIVYEMLTGRRAFVRESGAETLAAIIREEPVPLTIAAPSVPAPLRWIVTRCLAKNPKERYASTSDLARDIKTVREHLSELSGSGTATEIRAKTRFPRAYLAALAAFLLGVGVAALWLRSRSGPPSRPAPVLRPLTYTGRDYSPAVSPDGKTIAFVSDRDAKRRIWLKQIAGGGEQALTEGPDDFPRFSPDGSMVLFIRSLPGRLTSLWRQNVVGGEPHRVVEDAVYGDWSSDGKQIAFIRWSLEGGQVVSTLWLVVPDGSRAREIGHVGGQLTSPRFSPDGRLIASVAEVSGGTPAFFHVFHIGSGEATRLVPGGMGAPSSAAWVSDHEFVYLQSLSVSGAIVSTPGRVVLYDLASGNKETLMFVPQTGPGIEVLGDERLVLETASSAENLREIDLSGPEPGQSRSLTRGQATDRQPSYSPDGEWIVFSSNRSGNLDLWEVSTKTGVIRRLTDDPAEDWDPCFTPDGKSLLWSSNRSGALEIWIADADGNNARQLTHDGFDAENPTATPDGQWIYYVSSNPQKAGIWKIRSDGTRAGLIVPGGSLATSTGTPDLSPDGRYIAYVSTAERMLKVARADNGSVVMSTPTASSLFSFRREGVLGRPRWLPGALGVAFIGRDEDGMVGVFAQEFNPDVDTIKTRRKLGGFDTDSITETLGLSSDGMRLTIGSLERSQAIVLVENVPRVRRPR